ncbi:hypothetical protein [Sphingomonas solaris]|uniref:Uncharacterized protein n=1 Tax=Alterirhizorhabdus solaris TaxID=2529389 RepID=A0A558R5V0_9SPHN|nr:hypothetical protein [Sphingomonas solaris]TVV74747.1 hypothetical protein FOY91_08835 [Sphingomonas solaris]
MKQIERWVTRGRRLPFVFRAAIMLLVVAAIAGMWWQHQPAGSGTRDIIAFVRRACPAAHVAVPHPIVADGAHAIDRWAWAIVRGRCGTVRPAGHPEPHHQDHRRPHAADRTAS